VITVSPLSRFVESGRAPDELADASSIPTLVVEWDRAPGLFWTLRLCEYYGLRDVRWDYPAPVEWVKVSEGHWTYADHPVSGDAPIKGRASVAAKAKDDELDFEVILRNEASTTWQDCWGWVCLIHRWAGSFQANCELPAGPTDHPWLPCASLRAPKGRWLKWCPVRPHRQVADRIGQNQARMWQPHIEAAAGAVRAWRMDLERPIQQFVELSSDSGIILGWSHWPCTDMGLSFGSLEPEQSTTARGKLRYFEEPYERV
jgi:hypothetical protein